MKAGIQSGMAFYRNRTADGKGSDRRPVEWVEEPSYFFNLSAWQQPLLDHYQANPDFIAPESKRKEVISFVSGGLKDLSVSRTTFDWGVPVPGDPAHVMYVWLDALTNYITGDWAGMNFDRFGQICIWWVRISGISAVIIF